MNIDQAAQDRINELEADLVAEGQRIDLLLETVHEQEQLIRALKAQNAALMKGQKVNYEVA